MNKTEKKKYILDALDVRIIELKAQWAKNYIAMRVNQIIADDTKNSDKQIESAKKQVDATNQNMEVALQQIGLMEFILKEEK
jgi:hypothetical protein